VIPFLKLKESATSNSPAIVEIDTGLILAARICLLSVALLAASICTFLFDYKAIPDNLIYLPIALVFGFTALSALWMRRRKPKKAFIYIQLVTDILFVTGAVYVTGAASSPFLFLYLPVVMVSTIMLSLHAALAAAAFAVFNYSLLIYAVSYRWIPTADGGAIPALPPGGAILHIIGLSSGMILVAFLSNLLLNLMRASNRAVEKSKLDIAELSSSKKSLSQQLEMQDRMARLLAEKNTSSEFAPTAIEEFVGESLVMKKVFALIQKVAVSDATVLISGESGTGKELVARAIHLGNQGDRITPFVAVNCGAIPENLIESQLFGHKKGSFTGADSDHTGLFLQANEGTIFLDEIGELPLVMQSKLLRAIQERSVRPVGGSKDIPIEVRIVAATNKNLKREVELGNFREDLFYRLNVISIKLPPLRSRKEDIPLLAKSILNRLITNGKEAVIPPSTMQLLSDYNYPGNVRELENILERAVVLGGEIILPEHLPQNVRSNSFNINAEKNGLERETTIIIDENIDLPVNLDMILANVERKYLEIALLKTNGAKKKAADLLGMNFRSFRYRLQKFGISDE